MIEGIIRFDPTKLDVTNLKELISDELSEINASDEDFSLQKVYVEGHEDEILVQEVQHNVTVPTDPQSGQPAGQRAHKPFTFTCSLNKSVPMLYNALAAGEMLPKVEVKWYRTSTDGKQEHFFSAQLVDATIVDMDLVLPRAQNPVNSDYTQLLKVSMAYRKITWEHTTAGTSGFDDWRTPIEG